MFVGEIEVDESYFGDKVYTKIIPDASSTTLMPIIEPLMFAIERRVDLDHPAAALRL
jgi:hypothetical protein